MSLSTSLPPALPFLACLQVCVLLSRVLCVCVCWCVACTQLASVGAGYFTPPTLPADASDDEDEEVTPVSLSMCHCVSVCEPFFVCVSACSRSICL